MAPFDRHLGRDKPDFRLDCFGGYDGRDPVCRRGCALCLNCALAKASLQPPRTPDDRSASPRRPRPRHER